MCCFIMTVGFFGPRLGFLVYWIWRPVVIQATFHTWIWPLLGLVFLPWTTLMYVLVYGANGIVGFDWVLLALAVVLDIATYSGSAARRKSVPGYPSAMP